MTALSRLARYRAAIILAVIVGLSSLYVPGFFNLGTLSLGLDRGATIGIAAIGLTLLLIEGQIDLSGGAVFGLAGVVAISTESRFGLPAACVLGLLAAAAAGFCNGLLCVGLKVNSLMATLTTMLIIYSISHWITHSQPVAGSDIMFSVYMSEVFASIFTIRSAVFLVGILILEFWLIYTESGRNAFAIGSSAVAAKASGVRVAKVTWLSFIFASATAGGAGILESLVTNTGSPLFGSEVTLVIITAAVIGGTRLEGGRGSAFGTLGGVLILATLTTAMEYQSFATYTQQVIIGFILVAIISINQIIGSPRQ